MEGSNRKASLRVNRETVRHLSGQDLERVGGGINTVLCLTVLCVSGGTSCDPRCTCPYSAAQCETQFCN